MDWLGNVVFKDQELDDERLELTDKKANYILGPNLTLRNSEELRAVIEKFDCIVY